MATNDITGDDIRTKPSTDKFRDNWDAIFGKKGVDEDEEDIGEQDGKL